MSLAGLHLIRRQQRVLGRWVLALFCLVWLQAALLPCAMASMPDGMGAGADHCVYCPPDVAEPDLVLTAAECSFPDQPQADSRASLAAPLLLALPVVAYRLHAVAVHTPQFEHAAPAVRSGPPLAVTYCRFLK